MKRTIIKIDQEKCTGCGLCVPECVEGALKIIDGKAKLVSEKFCDGLGACLGKCPVGALVVETREAEEFDEKAAKTHEAMLHTSKNTSSTAQVLTTPSESKECQNPLPQWPIQLLLVSVNAPFLNHADLVIAADCVAFAYANFHSDLLKERKLLIGCPRLDDVQFYRKKLEALFKESQPRSVTVVNMEIPCCSGLYRIVQEALVAAGKDIPLSHEIIGIKGNRSQTS
jgi:NAD-dependent dihydropyrimidine dehydrogenase PreA subunit